MKMVEKDFWVDKYSGTVTHQMSVHVNGERVSAQVVTAYRGCTPPLDYVFDDLRRKLMRAVEDAIFRGVR